MGYYYDVFITCDRCNEDTPGYDRTVRAGRKNIRRDGWTYTNGVDLCPRCTRRAEAVESEGEAK